MADTNSNTGPSYQSLPDCESLYSAMNAALARLDFSNMDDDELSQVAEYCAETSAGLCHCLNFIGDALITFADNDVCESTPESLCQLGHGLNAISLLIPALNDMHRRAHAPTRPINL
ncbi:hypothetical protein [Dickeya fangzhongdai]|uniref:Uncharacterized protein n=1 Tax=Dickeya fangzhongdai TaxID=1778540 RepID=A0A2K8QL03_9GAMM|nr:hypothetical protein [Dickeya fangzhongdai]ATZ93410.1 hypothetical protein CVE23_05110 [Dickeya fangzhongdai]QOH46843.1 hypothetical protein DYD82_05155 [Dickeya fangzhongdai]QOH51148.1 hypothetical protein DYD83_05155 [Dickeya fangzhongdai]WOY01674.1 hypothetical protein OGM22_07645 [Dickeya fangzhongdai]WOY03060.1 hypothetical protein OGM21_14355 [Dickeya fangzhongdai]